MWQTSLQAIHFEVQVIHYDHDVIPRKTSRQLHASFVEKILFLEDCSASYLLYNFSVRSEKISFQIPRRKTKKPFRNTIELQNLQISGQ